MARKGEYTYDWAKAIRMLEEGIPKGEVAQAIGASASNFSKCLRDAIARGWTREGPPQGTAQAARRSTDVLQPEVRSEVREDRGGVPLDREEIEGLREILTWWRGALPEGRSTSEVRREVLHEVRGEVRARIGQTSRALYSFRIEKGLHDALKEQAERDGVSMADLVNEALRCYLEGQPGGTEQ